MSDPSADAQEVGPPPPRAWECWLMLLLLVLAIGGGLGYGPDALRRPFLTPAVIGAIIGAAGGWLIKPGQVPPRRSTLWVIALASVAAVGIMHGEVFRRIQRAASEHKSAPTPFHWTEQMLNEVDAPEAFRRELRLAQEPTLADYLAHRAAALVGETSAPLSLLLLASELALAAVVALGVFRQRVRQP